MGDMSFRLVQAVPSVSIKDGFVLVAGEGWGLCCTPQVLRDFCTNGIDVLNQPPPERGRVIRLPKAR